MTKIDISDTRFIYVSSAVQQKSTQQLIDSITVQKKCTRMKK